MEFDFFLSKHKKIPDSERSAEEVGFARQTQRTVDYESLRYIAPRTPRIQALIEQSRRDNHRRVRKVCVGHFCVNTR